ncbi:hypothetical protein GALMADRAFT_145721 [Galerina marginata CBS 339.88]|uniref:F-box domain-containing protein n=1 Tax=Galerina marginata (strain CBS 339.88) TaxID=685588 RepID=A0A067SNS4_GALM3|nr:hypothetical protein GALMADRAFT_145721 [Galerina marginata CBS 339.88]
MSKRVGTTLQNYATILPVEIWRECFMHLGISEHAKLAGTCHFFRGICRSFIFKSIPLSFQIEFFRFTPSYRITRQLERMTDNIGRFTKLAMSPQYAPLVRKCTLSYYLRIHTKTVEAVAKRVKDEYESFIQAIVNYIPRFVNLREIEINCTKKMDRRVLAVLATLPQVEKLSLVSVQFGVHQLKSQIKVKKLWIDNSRSDDNPNKAAKRLEIFSAEHLEELSVVSTAYAPKIFLALMNQGSLKNLTRLAFELNSTDLDVLYAFLAICPNLESIETSFGRYYGYYDANDIAFPDLPPSTLPLLRSFSGQNPVAKIFVPGRPVKKVSLEQFVWPKDRDYSELQDMMSYLLRSTGPVTDLAVERLRCTPELMAMLATQFPNLTRLKLGLSCLKVFPADDPHSKRLELAEATELVFHDAGSGASPSSDVMVPDDVHTVYMTLLHWIAHKRIVLPRNLETLHLRDESSFLSSPHERMSIVFYDSDSESMDPWPPKEKPYTFAVAKSIFDAVSTQYPALQRLVIRDVENLQWCKIATGKWVLLTKRQHGHYFAKG